MIELGKGWSEGLSLGSRRREQGRRSEEESRSITFISFELLHEIYFKIFLRPERYLILRRFPLTLSNPLIMHQSAQPIQHCWHHAVNSQSKLEHALSSVNEPTIKIQSIEADIIFSHSKQQSVMGHPPDTDGDLTLTSFLEQLQSSQFQYSSGKCTQRIVKLDFKCNTSFQSSIPCIQSYLQHLPTRFHHSVWINADILPGPGEDLDDAEFQLKLKPKFNAHEFLETVTNHLTGTTLSIGWTTSLTDKRAVYTNEMVNGMIQVLKPYSKLQVTFPVRATSFRNSWNALKLLYENDWTVTLWWSLDKLESEEMDWIYTTLEEGDELLKNRTYYDLIGFPV